MKTYEALTVTLLVFIAGVILGMATNTTPDAKNLSAAGSITGGISAFVAVIYAITEVRDWKEKNKHRVDYERILDANITLGISARKLRDNLLDFRTNEEFRLDMRELHPSYKTDLMDLTSSAQILELMVDKPGIQIFVKAYDVAKYMTNIQYLPDEDRLTTATDCLNILDTIYEIHKEIYKKSSPEPTRN